MRPTLDSDLDFLNGGGATKIAGAVGQPSPAQTTTADAVNLVTRLTTCDRCQLQLHRQTQPQTSSATSTTGAPTLLMKDWRSSRPIG
jgi:hypothetical protein